MAIKQANNITLLDVVNDGFSEMKLADCEGFDYKIGEIAGGELKLVFEPKTHHFDSVQVDGVNDMGFTLVFEE